MQIGDWDRAPVDVDEEKDPNNMNVDEMVLVKPYPSEERCCIHNHLCKAVPLTGTNGSARGLPLQGPGVRNLRPESRYPRVGSACARARGFALRPGSTAQGPCPGGIRTTARGRAPAAFRGGLLSKAPGPGCPAPRGSSLWTRPARVVAELRIQIRFRTAARGADAGAPSITGAMGVPREHTAAGGLWNGGTRPRDLQVSVPRPLMGL